MHNADIWCVIPVYNNASTVATVARGCRQVLEHVLVVDDGSTDADLAALLQGIDVTLLRHDANRGKGRALLTALDHICHHGGRYMITIDADGQHMPEDLGKFLAAIDTDDTALYVGSRDFSADNVPEGSKFGRRFSNLWFRIETGVACSDTQSGFRAYPVNSVSQLGLKGHRYEFEVEVLTRAAWAGLPIRDIPISVYYPRPEERVSHFDKVRDNVRISLMHMRLVGRRLLPLPHRRLVHGSAGRFDVNILRQPGRLFRMLLAENATPMGLAAAAAVGTILAVLPLPGVHSVAIVYVSTRLHLNKVMALAIQNLYIPPFVPFLCIEVGYFLRHGHWLTDLSLTMFKENWRYLFVDWLIGSLILAPFYAAVAAVTVYVIAGRMRARCRTGVNDD